MDFAAIFGGNLSALLNLEGGHVGGEGEGLHLDLLAVLVRHPRATSFGKLVTSKKLIKVRKL